MSNSEKPVVTSIDTSVDPELLELLCCPNCKGEVAYHPADDELSCGRCQFIYPIVEGVPVMFPFNVKEKFDEMFERHWDSEDRAALYDNHVEGAQSRLGMYVHVGETESTMRVLGEIPPGCFLDCGCGNGRFFDQLRSDHFTVGIDASLNMLRIVRRKGRCKRLVCCELENLPFKSNTFERILSVRVLQHLVKQREAVEEMARVCAPGGQVILNLYNDLCSKALVKKIRGSALGPILNFPFRVIKKGYGPFGPWPVAYDKYNTAVQVRRWMRRSGLNVTELVGSGFSFNKWLLNDFWIAAFMEKRWPNTLQKYLDTCLAVEERLGRWWPFNHILEKFVIKGEKLDIDR